MCCRIGMYEDDSDYEDSDGDLSDALDGDARDIIDDYFPKEFKDTVLKS